MYQQIYLSCLTGEDLTDIILIRLKILILMKTDLGEIAMTKRRTQKTHKASRTRQSLTASGWLKPQCWQISKIEAAEALRMPVNRIVKVYPKQHQVIVVYLNQKGQKCSSFFSYRLFARWEQETIATIASCRNQQALAPLEVIVQYDLEHFKYPVQSADAIWDALLHHIRRAITEQRHTQKCA
ncbi:MULTISPECIES: hypothetical protein [unclassified Microcoleus]|uniref:hypothetical protein n=1 Tax=unclassified Microcoleus TaxID=2642155 RepID=UPI002FD1F58B